MFFLFRLFPGLVSYEEAGSSSSPTAVDNLLDSVTSLLWAQPKDRQPLLRTFTFMLGKRERENHARLYSRLAESKTMASVAVDPRSFYYYWVPGYRYRFFFLFIFFL